MKHELQNLKEKWRLVKLFMKAYEAEILSVALIIFASFSFAYSLSHVEF